MSVTLARKVATSVRREPLGDIEELRYKTIVRYHDTDIVKFSENYIELNTGGWFTATTKKRMNQAASEYGLDFYVYQLDGTWYVRRGEVRYGFNGNVAVLKRY